ncbi:MULTISPECIES: 1,2-phenylacetyl-CoA epoxidase subunit PaaC [Lysinibacillus]|uniref:Phenylacetate-CoA oxygenase subunit PaaI n=1 Tax=Lysinibacillus antri TaxID=2498145 RepID=A0A3S0P7L0_9BACI|nr:MULTISPECIES: 1,2-phenylacetyl-CoA epoxidase subunit PaaC [Lysinibacillus]RUL51777.1 phenylacetate-CoA oxygenase subunit PaaI [Lysinibacillus antri]TSI04534.1 phenylacetate-CoA oxygenase subunit PaaC [Lysinibacillus sp. BW-2-10]
MTGNIENPVVELLFQLADDDYLFSYRGSEWLGLAPHIEEDVAFSSITQDTMGHATMFYRLLEGLGVGVADSLAHIRPASERKNSILVERPNGEGYYMDNPQYDWAYAVARNYIYTTAKKIKIDSLKSSSDETLRDAAVKVSMEIYYHLLHWKTWFVQLFNATEDARKRMTTALEKVLADCGDLFSYGEAATAITNAGLIESEEVLVNRWIEYVKPVFETIKVEVPTFGKPQQNGRNQEHTKELQQAIDTMSEVYATDLAASW